jgi:FMN phosphatase YigB (HAD superfamily)
MTKGLAVFFDIGDTLASPRVAGGHLSGLDVYPFVPEILTRLRISGGQEIPIALGLISNTGSETAATLHDVLAKSGLSNFVDASLCLFSSIEGLDKSQPAFFLLARDRAALPATRCVFVGEDPAERTVAASIGFRVSPHPLHALHLIESELSAQQP